MLRPGTPMPSLDGATEWLFGEPPANRGGPILVHFWAMSCYLCKEQLPILARLTRDYAVHGLWVVSIHAPRQPSDTDIEAVKRAAQELGLTAPIGIDNAHHLADRFEIGGIWPSYFLFDKDGKLRSRSAGSAGLGFIEATLSRIAA